MVARGNYAGAAQMLSSPEGKAIYHDADRVLFNIDIGMLECFAADTNASNRNLDEAERLIEAGYTKSISNAAASFLLNDTVLDYPGEPYEDLYINVFKSLNYLKQNNFDDAFVEVRRVNTKLGTLEGKYGSLADGMNHSKDASGSVKAGTTEFHDSALAHYLSMLLYRADGKLDDAQIDFKRLGEAFRTQPHVYNFPLPELSAALIPGQKAKLNVIGFTGRAPTKRANTLYLRTAPNMIQVATTQENTQGRENLQGLTILPVPGVQGGYFFKCQLPEIVRNGSAVARIVVVIDGVPAGDLALLESIENAAIETYKVKEPIIYVKTIVRTVVKGIVAQAAKRQAQQKLESQGSLGIIGGLLGGVALDIGIAASEQADLRCARYLPARASVGEFEVEPGMHEVSVEYLDKGGSLLWTDVLGRTSVEQNGLNLLTSYALF
jgi:uncharacterized protein